MVNRLRTNRGWCVAKKLLRMRLRMRMHMHIQMAATAPSCWPRTFQVVKSPAKKSDPLVSSSTLASHELSGVTACPDPELELTPELGPSPYSEASLRSQAASTSPSERCSVSK